MALLAFVIEHSPQIVHSAANYMPALANSRDDVGNSKLNLFPHKYQKGSHLSPSHHCWPWGVWDDQHKIPVKVSCHIFGHGDVEDERNDLCAIFEWGLVDGDLEFGPGGNLMTEARLVETANRNLEQSVFVNVIEFPEHPEKRREFWVRAIVRLYRLDSCPHGQTKLLNSALGFLKLTSTTRQRESEPLCSRRRALSGLMNGNSVDQVIKRGAKIVDAVSDLKRECLENCPSVGMEDPTMTGTIGVQLLGDAVIFRLQSGSRFNIDGIEVL